MELCLKVPGLATLSDRIHTAGFGMRHDNLMVTVGTVSFDVMAQFQCCWPALNAFPNPVSKLGQFATTYTVTL